ncbi:NAD(P)-binding protein [Mycena indigotica]|uniref:NAD(P)-binding protein n=1 Tax=Mycena indigotica TaxID=2126181 RepID=A0A8H6SVY2_9AGAR|nr:NAD(P)-binding protein [Mycena indigotica]KAF7306278.1 NAD(P)-binding protein [Mycena indigotica]
MSARVWLVTGASSGFGLDVTKVALRMKEKVVAVSRNPDDLRKLVEANPDDLIAIGCDVTVEEDVITAFASGVEKFGQIDVVFNNAGTAILGELEAVPNKAARALFEVNFWGALSVSKEAVRVFREVNPAGAGGRLLNMSSGVGFSAMPLSVNMATLEGLTEALAGEVDPAWNIKVLRSPLVHCDGSHDRQISVIGPGAFKTGMHGDRTLKFPAPSAYDKEGLPSRFVREWFEDGSGIRGNPAAAAETIFKFSQLETPPKRWAVGKDAIGGVRIKIAAVSEETTAFESWSDGLELPIKPDNVGPK